MNSITTGKHGLTNLATVSANINYEVLNSMKIQLLLDILTITGHDYNYNMKISLQSTINHTAKHLISNLTLVDHRMQSLKLQLTPSPYP